MLDVWLFTLAGREEHVATLAVHSTEGFLLVCILLGYVIWQKTAKNTGQSHLTENSVIHLVNIMTFCGFYQTVYSDGSTTKCATFLN